LAFFDELGEPGVVEMAAEVARFDVALPEAWEQEACGDVEGVFPMAAEEAAGGG
jgi:hypothetical protein